MADTNTATPATTEQPTAPAAVPARESVETKPFAPRPTREQALKSGLETMEKLERAKGILPEAKDAQPAQTPLPEDEKKEQPRAADGKFAPKDDASKAEKPDAVESKFSAADREKAVTGLRRARVPQAALDALSEDDRVQWGLDLAKSQSENDRRVTEATKTKTQIADPASKSAGEPAQTGNLRGLSDDLGLDDVGHSKLEAAFTARDTQIHGLREENNALKQSVLEAHVEHAFGELAKEFPELATDDGRKAVFPRVLRMIEGGDYETAFPRLADQAREVVRDASGIEFRDSIAERQAARAKSARRDAGQPTPPTPGKVTKPTTRKEYALTSMQLLEQGLSSDEVKARLGG